MNRDVAPPTADQPTDDDAAALIAFIHERDVACPECGYNLRDLSKATCPECRRALRLTVGLIEQRIGWLFITLAPCVFSGIAAFILGLPIVIAPLVNPSAGGAPPGFVALDAFGWVSAFVGLVLWVRRRSFLRTRRSLQLLWALGVWLVHLVAFALLVMSVI